MKLNTKQCFEIINVVNKLGIKQEIREVLLGEGVNSNKKREFAVREREYFDKVIKAIETKIPYVEYESLDKDGKDSIYLEVASKELIKEGAKLEKLRSEINDISMNEGFNLIYTAIIERFYSNQEVIYKALSKIYKIDILEIENQSPVKTLEMIKNIINAKEIGEMMKLFR